ncbi:aspartyl-phosphate phosphatase Spo0E family protein [Thermoactinomyces mirandus]|uniref:Spo0E family sporulation regulatory protein-aspartic acid phosphatase n=1 Tax=Thermoactinomyces mirandus TaxID=2756294 RepID=A0A7W1XRR2_9BACL|nr:aspartyl-phosphate phosphatase Spo0E family protein [Thermoactinomyces mirandus]MBA4602097.1 Spo0E family sporulation regulatory protein-aspartic acid phosphatase [Thermoactinomyces mirandus]
MSERNHRIRRLQKEMERLRNELYQSVNGEPERLMDAHVLPLSEQLDVLIVEMQRIQLEHCL